MRDKESENAEGLRMHGPQLLHLTQNRQVSPLNSRLTNENIERGPCR